MQAESRKHAKNKLLAEHSVILGCKRPGKKASQIAPSRIARFYVGKRLPLKLK
jgi:hypothetical protein